MTHTALTIPDRAFVYSVVCETGHARVNGAVVYPLPDGHLAVGLERKPIRELVTNPDAAFDKLMRLADREWRQRTAPVFRHISVTENF